MKYRILTVWCLALLSSCTVHIMDAELVSMSTKEMPRTALKKGEKIEVKWCANDEPLIPSPDKQYGLMDQVITKAEKQTNSKYFLETSFYQSNRCITMTGYPVAGASAPAAKVKKANTQKKL